jgi:hypothetical protein
MPLERRSSRKPRLRPARATELGSHAHRAARGRRCHVGRAAGAGSGSRQVLLQILLKRGIGLLRGGEISRLQGLAQGGKALRERITLLSGGRAGTLRATRVMMTVAVYRPRLLLNILLNRREIFLCLEHRFAGKNAASTTAQQQTNRPPHAVE